MWGYLSKAAKVLQDTVGLEEDTDDKFHDTVENEEEAAQQAQERASAAASCSSSADPVLPKEEVGDGGAVLPPTRKRDVLKDKLNQVGSGWMGSMKNWVKAVQHDIGLHTADESRQVMLELESRDLSQLSPDDLFTYFTDIVDRVEGYGETLLGEASSYRDARMTVEQAIMASEDMHACYVRWDMGVNKPLTKLHELIALRISKDPSADGVFSWGIDDDKAPKEDDTPAPPPAQLSEEAQVLWNTLLKRIVAVRDETVDVFMGFLEYVTMAQEGDAEGLLQLDSRRNEARTTALQRAVEDTQRHKHTDPVLEDESEIAIRTFVQQELHERTLIVREEHDDAEPLRLMQSHSKQMLYILRDEREEFQADEMAARHSTMEEEEALYDDLCRMISPSLVAVRKQWEQEQEASLRREQEQQQQLISLQEMELTQRHDMHVDQGCDRVHIQHSFAESLEEIQYKIQALASIQQALTRLNDTVDQFTNSLVVEEQSTWESVMDQHLSGYEQSLLTQQLREQYEAAAETEMAQQAAAEQAEAERAAAEKAAAEQAEGEKVVDEQAVTPIISDASYTTLSENVSVSTPTKEHRHVVDATPSFASAMPSPAPGASVVAGADVKTIFGEEKASRMVLIDAVKAERKWMKGLMDLHLSQHAHRGALLKEEPKCRYAYAKWFVAEFGAMGARKKAWDAEEAARKALLATEDSEWSTMVDSSP